MTDQRPGGAPRSPSGETRWTDTHCHLAWEGSSAAEQVADAAAAGVHRLITIGTQEETSKTAIEVASQHDNVWATVGLHPHDAVEGVDSIAPLTTADRVVAIGECGLDYFYEHSPRDAQQEAFAAQIALANQHRLALVIHTREAWDDTFQILRAERIPERVVFHCFTGGPQEAKRCLEAGGYLSFSGIISFKNAADIRDAAAMCPADRLLVETDAPYLAPVPHRGKENRPAWVAVVGGAVAAARGEEPVEVAAHTWANAERVFGLTGPPV
ncbi:MAG TPA: TatD family hydrolase [Acidimicrobiales bacterium]|nr:TatD family hydrolase [Acidimicrobiales bacterium]